MSESFSNYQVKALDADSSVDVKPFELKDLRQSKTTSFKTPTLKKSVSQYVKDSRFDFDPLIKSLMVQEATGDAQAAQIEIEVEKRLGEFKAEAMEAAREAGRIEGLKAGEDEAKTKFTLEYQSKIENLNRIISGFEKIKPDMQAAQEKFLMELIFKVTTQVIRRELQSDKEYLIRTIHDVLEKVESREQLRIQVAESELQQVYAILPELEKQYSGLKNISIDPSQHLGPYDVVLETDWNRIDATLDSQLESFKLLMMPEKNES